MFKKDHQCESFEARKISLTDDKPQASTLSSK